MEGEDLVTLVTWYSLRSKYTQTSCAGKPYRVCGGRRKYETIPQKLAKTDPKKVLAAGGIVLVILILLVYLIVRRSGKKRVSGEKEEAEKSGKEN